MFKKVFCLFLLVSLLALPVLAADAQEEAEQVMHAKAIDWNELTGCLPEKIANMETEEPDGGSMSMADPNSPGQQLSYSYAERTYTSGDKSITLRITDTGWSQFLTMPYMMAIEMDTPDASIKTVDVAGQPAKRIQSKEKGKVKSTQFLLLVSERVLVMAEGNEKAGSAEIEDLIKKIDFEKLTALAK